MGFHLILLSGGSGKRLWPLSNDVRSKQFLKLFRAQDGGYESMVQRIYRQVRLLDKDADITVATAKSQISTLRNQLGADISISVEPCRRDTFPAIVLAASYLQDVKGVSPEECVVVVPVDPYVEEDYFLALRELHALAEQGTASIALLGMEPTYPSEKYGYIIPETKDRISAVRAFREKPDKETAKAYIEQGALWNGGVFAFRLGYLLERAHALMRFQDYHDLYTHYEDAEKISFDYAVVEKESSLQVLRFAGSWKDLGTWNTLTEAMEDNIIGNAVTDAGCSDVHIINELDVPLLAFGLSDVVISASPEGILVSDKEQSSYIKPYVDRLEGQTMFALKSWGSFRVIDVDSTSLTIKVTLNAGHAMNYHSHRHRDEVWVVISGRGRTLVDGMEQEIQPGDVIAMSAGCKHTVFADTELKMIEVQLGEEISAEDKQKYELPR